MASGLTFQRGTTQTLWANFLSDSGEEATTITGAKITIKHFNPDTSSVETDINEAALTFSAETLYYYRWAIPSTAQEGTYTVEYEAIVDGVLIEATQEIYVSATATMGTGGTSYTTAALVANLLGVDSSEIDDDWLYWATAMIDTYTCQSWSSHIATEKFDIEHTSVNTIKLEHYPIISVDYVKDDGTTLGTDEYLIYEDIGMIKLPEDTYLSSSLFSSGYFTQGRQKVEVKYTWGSTAVPYQIQLAATMLAAKFGKIKFGAGSSDITEKQIGDTRVRYAAQSSPSQGGALGWSINMIFDKLLSAYKCRDNLAV